MTWVLIKDLKLSNPVDLVEYVVVNNVKDELVFKWWVRDTLKKRDCIISKVKQSVGEPHINSASRFPRQLMEHMKWNVLQEPHFEQM